MGLFYAELLNNIRCFAQTGCINESVFNSFNNNSVLNSIPCGPRYFRYYGFFFHQKGIHKCRFSRIGFTYYYNRDTILYSISKHKRICQPVCKVFDFYNNIRKFISVGKFNIFLTKIKFQFNKRRKMKQLCSQPAYLR